MDHFSTLETNYEDSADRNPTDFGWKPIQLMRNSVRQPKKSSAKQQTVSKPKPTLTAHEFESDRFLKNINHLNDFWIGSSSSLTTPSVSVSTGGNAGQQSELRPSSINFTRANMLLNARVNWTPTRPVIVSGGKQSSLDSLRSTLTTSPPSTLIPFTQATRPTFNHLKQKQSIVRPTPTTPSTVRKAKPTLSQKNRKTVSSFPSGASSSSSTDHLLLNDIDIPRSIYTEAQGGRQKTDQNRNKNNFKHTRQSAGGATGRPNRSRSFGRNRRRNNRLAPRWIVSGPFVEHAAEQSMSSASLVPAPSPFSQLSENNRRRLTQVLSNYFRLMGTLNSTFDKHQEQVEPSPAALELGQNFQRLTGQLHDQLLDSQGQPIDLSEHIADYIQPQASNDLFLFSPAVPFARWVVMINCTLKSVLTICGFT